MKKLYLLFGMIFCALCARAQAYTLQERLQEAAQLYFAHKPLASLEKYIQISKDTEDRSSFLNAIFIAMEQNKPKEAVDIALEAYRLYSQDEEVIEMAAEALLGDGQYAAAERMLSFLPQHNETMGFFHINLARAQLGLGEKKLAKYNLKQAVKAGAHSGLANFLLGEVYDEENEYKKAAEAYQKAIDYDHQFIEARLHLARALERSQQFDEAYKQFRIMYLSDPKNTRAADALNRLKPKLKKPQKETPQEVPSFEYTSVQPLVLPPGVPAPKEIKIGLGVNQYGKPSAHKILTFSASHAFSIIDSANHTLATGQSGDIWQAVLENKHAHLLGPDGKKIPFKHPVFLVPTPSDSTQAPTFVLKNLMSGAGMSWASVSDKEYRGKLQIIHNTQLDTLVPVNVISLDEYVQGIIAAEMPAGFPLQALYAQAVLARTYTLKHLGKHKAYGYDLCDSQNCQVYGGVRAETEAGNQAVEATLGQILTYQNKPIESVFSANCGGATQSAKEAGWNETAYLRSVSDYQKFDLEHIEPYHFKKLLQYPPAAYSKYDKNVSMAAFRWARVVSEPQLRNVIKNQKKDIGQITALIPQERSHAGYVTKLLVKGTKGSVTLSKENVIRNNLSMGMLRSSYFIVQPIYENRQLKSFIFYGGGWGHGVGFCQTGAAGRAEAGQDYKTILNHYFSQAQLQDVQ